MTNLEKRQVLLLHQILVDQFGGSHGVRDDGLLDSALAMPYMTFFGQDLYPSLEAKAAQLCYGLVKNHPFIDGNKRIGAHCMLTLLELNGMTLQYEQDDLQDCILSVANSELDANDLAAWIRNHTAED